MYRGITLAILKAFGKVLFVMHRLKTYVRELVMTGAASRKIFNIETIKVTGPWLF